MSISVTPIMIHAMIDGILAGDHLADAAVLDDGIKFDSIRHCGLVREVAWYEAWLYGSNALDLFDGSDFDPEPVHFIHARTRSEMIERLRLLPAALAAKIVVKAMVGGMLCPIDQDGNALDPCDHHVVGNAV